MAKPFRLAWMLALRRLTRDRGSYDGTREQSKACVKQRHRLKRYVQ